MVLEIFDVHTVFCRQGLRTLELCVDNLQPDFLYDHIQPVRAELMQVHGSIMSFQALLKAQIVLDVPEFRFHPINDHSSFKKIHVCSINILK